MDTKEVLIAGAGISGLVAGRLLLRSGLEVGIIEGRKRTGGRILSIYEHGVTVEAGPEFIHGHLEQTISLLNKYHIPLVRTAGKMYVFREGRLVQQQQNGEHWNQLLDEMKKVKSDLPFRQFLMNHFGGSQYHELRESAMRYAAGFDLADVNTVSTCSLIREWELEDSPQYRIPSGYGKLTESLTAEFLSAGGEILLGQTVRQVQWTKDAATVITTENQKYAARKLLITLPAGVLTHQHNGHYTVSFVPDIPAKRIALSEIGFGTVIKITLYWKTAFWERITPGLQFIFADKEIPTWWTQNPGSSPVLTGWLGGPAANDFSALTDEAFTQMAVENLSSLFGMQSGDLKQNLLDAKIHNWEKDDFTRGAYSFELAAFPEAKKSTKAPVENTLYFAGEACYQGPHGGTVEAAIMSGMEAAQQIKEAFSLH